MNLVETLKNLRPWFAWAPPWVFTLVLVALALVVALSLHSLGVRVVQRSLRGDKAAFWRPFVVRTRGLGRLVLVVAALSAALGASPLTRSQTALVQHLFAIAIVVQFGWAAMVAIDIGSALYLRRYRVDVEDNLLARKHLTQIRILQRAAVVAVAVLTAAFALMTINQVRQWGVSLLAAGGAATVIVGLALQPLLSNLIAGIQMAITQPIRMDDQVKVENEVGNVEEITATYIVVRVWDERRIILPLTYFLQKPFENWTRESARQKGNIVLHVDYATPIEALRAKFGELVKADPRWDGLASGLAVSDAKERSLEITCTVSAADSGKLGDLKSAIREGLITYLRETYPNALPRERLEVAASTLAWAGGDGEAREAPPRPQ
jgi:small-conductance mechanosensitive channel